jgi:hypothetical protein
MQRGDQRHVMPEAPFRVSAHEAKRVRFRMIELSAGNGYDELQEFAAMALRLPGKFVVYRVAAGFGASFRSGGPRLPCPALDVIEGALDRRNRVEAPLAAGAPPPFSRDDFESLALFATDLRLDRYSEL